MSPQDFDPGKPAEQRSSSLCRSNLHKLSCQLPKQYKHRGETCHFLELWVERGMGSNSTRTKGRMRNKPELLVVAMNCERMVLQRMAVELDLNMEAMLDSSSGSSSSSGDGSAPAARGRLSSWQKLCMRYSAPQEPVSAVSASGCMLGNSSMMELDEWRTVQVRGLGFFACSDQ
jgi:hypothetical protein